RRRGVEGRLRTHRPHHRAFRVAPLHAPQDAQAPAEDGPDRRELLLARRAHPARRRRRGRPARHARRGLGGRGVIFHETGVAGVYIIELELRSDERGFFARSYCANEFAEHGLEPAVVQANVSFNHKAGTLRGMHYQVPPAAETKLVRCTSGAIHDVIVDLRPDSPTYLQHVAVDLTAENRLALFVPRMFAHGYQTLTDGAEVTYQVSE